MTTNEYPLTQEEFKEWLLSKKSHEPVGYQHSCNYCPIYSCLKHHKGVKVFSVLGGLYKIGELLCTNKP